MKRPNLLPAALIAMALVCSSFTAQPDPAAGDAAWAEVIRTPKATTKPAAAELADKLQKFYKTYPNHPKAADAWMKEQSLRQQSSGGTPAQQPNPASAKAPGSFADKLKEASARISRAKAAGPAEGLAEIELSARKLIAEFPAQPEGWNFLLTAAEGFGGEKGKLLCGEVIAKAPTPKLKNDARMKLQALQAPQRAVAAVPPSLSGPGKPFPLAFTAMDKRQVDLADMRDKVVLIDFGATWCGPCVAGMPEVTQVYSQFHDQGFEIIGVSLDQDLDRLKQFVALKSMPWPQFFDGGGWNNVLAKRYGIESIPTMYLIDKNGNLRSTDARGDLPRMVAALLKE